jgi:hypothetical protein
MLYISPTHWIKLDLAVTRYDWKRIATVTVCAGVSNQWVTRGLESRGGLS